jgi:hypothetical protein
MTCLRRMKLLPFAPVLLASLASLTATAAPAPTPSSSRLSPEAAGPVEGLAVITLVATQDSTRCGGVSLTAKMAPHADRAIAPDDAAFAAIYSLPFPTGLDFSPAHKKASTERFDAWVADMKKLAATANDRYSALFAASADDTAPRDPAARLIAAARIAQITRHFAGELLRAAIPADVRAEPNAAEKTAAYCSLIADVAAPLLAKANDAAHACGLHANDAPPGWWSTICVP